MFRYLPLLLLPVAVQAQGQNDIFSCTFEQGAKAVQVQLRGEYLNYEFGDGRKTLELGLQQSLFDGTFYPWPGVGGSIWESVSFYTEGYGYEVWSSIERDPSGPPEAGGINVTNGTKAVAELICDRGSVSSDFAGLSDEMYGRGLCWNHGTQEWLKGGCD